METSPFARLSAELRNEIYAYTLYIPKGVWLNNEKDEEKNKPIRKRRLQASGNPTALTMTCRQIHAESVLLFYSINRFFIRPHSLGSLHPPGEYTEWVWRGKFRAWMDTVGPSNASCVNKLCLHVQDCHTSWDLYDYLDGIIDILPSKRRAWPASLRVSLNFTLYFLDMESPDSNDHRWVPASFELPLHDRSEAKRQIDLVFNEKLIRLRELLKRLEEEVSQEQEKRVGNARKRTPQMYNFSNVLQEERSILGIRDNIDDVEEWRDWFFGPLLDLLVRLGWDEPNF